MNRNYIPTNWRNHIVDIESGDVIQEGTRFTASRANNIEDGILGAYDWLDAYKDEITKLRVQLEMIGRVPINSGTFFDAIDGDGGRKALSVLTDSAVSQTLLNAGATKITLDNVPFKANEYITIYDDEKSETVIVSSAGVSSVTVPALVNEYKKGAKVARTNSKLDEFRNTLGFGAWGNLSVNIVEVI